jgi:RNA polymerase sigma factor (sigma-70 family)
MAVPETIAPMQPSYAELYREHHGRVVSLCRMMLRDPDEAAEVTQEVFLALHRQMQFETRPMVWGAWLTRVAVNGCRDRRRSGWWRLWRDGGGDGLAEGRFAAPGPSPEDEVASREQRALVWQAFQKLPMRQREVAALRLVEGWSTDEVAELLNVSSGSVKRHLSRAVHRLRAVLGGRS